jgi:hypothetical protein
MAGASGWLVVASVVWVHLASFCVGWEEKWVRLANSDWSTEKGGGGLE